MAAKLRTGLHAVTTPNPAIPLTPNTQGQKQEKRALLKADLIFGGAKQGLFPSLPPLPRLVMLPGHRIPPDSIFQLTGKKSRAVISQPPLQPDVTCFSQDLVALGDTGAVLGGGLQPPLWLR